MLKAAEAQETGARLPSLGNWNETRSPDDDDLVQIMMVAWASHHYLQLWRLAA